MTGSADSIISPSSVTTTRRTPWVAGCCGPTLRVISWVCSSRSARSRMITPTPVPSAAWNATPPPLGVVGPPLPDWSEATVTPPAPWPPARAWPPWPAGRTPCAAGGPRTPPAAAAWPGAGGPRRRPRTARRSRARASRPPPTGRARWAGRRRRAAPASGPAGGGGGWWSRRAAPPRSRRPPRRRRRGSRSSCSSPRGRGGRTRPPGGSRPGRRSRSAGRAPPLARAPRRTRRPGGPSARRRPLGAHHDRLELAAGVALAQRLAADALLKLDDPVQQRLRPRWAAGHVDVDGDDLADALGHRVGVPVGAAAVGAGAEADHVLGLGHLVVEALDRRRHLVGQGAGDDQQVRLARAVGEGDHPEADEVVARRRGGDELDGAAGQAEVEHPQGVLAAPVEDELDRLRQL